MLDAIRSNACVNGLVGNGLDKKKGAGVLSPAGFLRFPAVKIRVYPSCKSELAVSEERVLRSPENFSVLAQASPCISRALRRWEKNLKPNMIEINSVGQLVDFLLNAGNKLVVIDFYSPGCGGCKALHPKISQFAEMNPDVQFLKVNYEEHKAMCKSLNIHVLPFFRFYRGAQGRLCSFSCTIATIKKFKDALAKHNNDSCSVGPAKGLEESELLNLASDSAISFDFLRRSSIVAEDLAMADNKK